MKKEEIPPSLDEIIEIQRESRIFLLASYAKYFLFFLIWLGISVLIALILKSDNEPDWLGRALLGSSFLGFAILCVLSILRYINWRDDHIMWSYNEVATLRRKWFIFGKNRRSLPLRSIDANDVFQSSRILFWGFLKATVFDVGDIQLRDRGSGKLFFPNLRHPQRVIARIFKAKSEAELIEARREAMLFAEALNKELVPAISNALREAESERR